VHGDPELLCGNPDCFAGTNSLEAMVSEIVPQSGVRFSFSYEYDFGDRWQHEVLFRAGAFNFLCFGGRNVGA
jgi:hypothetical protein